MLPEETKLEPQQAELGRWAYVCSMSEYNLPEYESCLLRRPEYLVLVVSDYEKIQAAAERFAQVIESRMPGIKVLRPDLIKQRTFKGTDLNDFQLWIDTVLAPLLDELPKGLGRICNLTGGTKMMALALMTANLNWEWLEYKAEGSQQLQMNQFEEGSLKALGVEPLPLADPLDVVRLYSDQVRKNKENTVIVSPDSVSEAQKIWDALEQRNPYLLELFGNQVSGLEMLWMYGLADERFMKKWLNLSTEEFIGQSVFSDGQLQWLQGWAQLKPSSLQLTENSIELAGNKNSRDDLRRWLSGDWLEQLAASWLAEKIPAERIVINVRVRPENQTNSSSGERESDILVHYKGATSLVEVKTDLPPHETFAKAIQQLASIGNRFGRTNKVLLVGPQLMQKNQNKLDELILRSNAEGILLAHDKQSLLLAVGQGKQPKPFQ